MATVFGPVFDQVLLGANFSSDKEFADLHASLVFECADLCSAGCDGGLQAGGNDLGIRVAFGGEKMNGDALLDAAFDHVGGESDAAGKDEHVVDVKKRDLLKDLAVLVPDDKPLADFANGHSVLIDKQLHESHILANFLR